MKVLHIEDRFHSEFGYQINFFAKFHSPNDEFIILCSNSVSLWDNTIKLNLLKQKDLEFEKKYKIRIMRLPVRLEKKSKYNIWIIGLISEIERINPDVIYVHGMETLTAIRIFLNRKLKKYRIVTDTHTLLNQFRNSLKFKIFISFFKFFVGKQINKRKITCFFTTHENEKIMKEIYQINPENIESCLIGTDSTVYYFDEKQRDEVRKTINCTDNSIVIVYTGKLNNFKKPNLIFEAVKIIEKQIDSPLHLLFIGNKSQPYFNDNFNIKFENQLIKAHFIGSVKNTELYKYYSASDFAVFPKENTLSCLDAQLCKLPVIMENDFTNQVRLRYGGLTYQQENLNDLAEKILFLVQNLTERTKFGDRGYKYIEQNFNYQRIIAKMESVLSMP